jgi:hypothetical protein
VIVTLPAAMSKLSESAPIRQKRQTNRPLSRVGRPMTAGKERPPVSIKTPRPLNPAPSVMRHRDQLADSADRIARGNSRGEGDQSLPFSQNNFFERPLLQFQMLEAIQVETAG